MFHRCCPDDTDVPSVLHARGTCAAVWVIPPLPGPGRAAEPVDEGPDQATEDEMRVQMMTSTREPAQAAGRPAVEIEHLRKTYGSVVAVDDVSFSVVEGAFFDILGPHRPGPDPGDRGSAAPGERLPGQAQGRRDPRGVPVLLPSARRRQRAGRDAGAGRQAPGLLPVAVRRPAAAPVGRAGP